MKRRATVAALALVVPLALGTSIAVGQDRPAAREVGASHQSITLDGAGANSIEPFFSAVFYNYHKQYPNVTINYSPAGSSVGISDIQQNTVAFGDTEVPMAAKDLAKAKGTVLQVPVDLGGVAISYNVPGAPKGLRLDGSTLAAIFEGVFTNWDSPALAQATGVSNLPNLPIVPVHRADSSGPGWDLDE
jgi:phosphate transport system substrate-binding protein